MKRKITIEEHDDMPKGENRQKVASQGMHGDTRLAHVNPWEEMLLKRLGGAGTRNPKTGLKQYYTSSDVSDWYKNALGRAADPAGLKYWMDYGNAADENSPDVFNAFVNAAKGAGENYTGWKPSDTQSLAPLWDLSGSYAGNKPKAQPAGTLDFPTNIMPATNQASSSNQSNTEYSGLPPSYQNILLAALMPQLQASITNMPGNIDQYTNNALGSYQQMMTDSLKKNIPAAIANLANRGIISSTEGNKVLSDVYSNAATDAANKGYQTAMQAALLKQGMLTTLANIAGLGKSTSSGGTSTSQGSSNTQDPTQMYQILASMIMAQM